MRTIKVHATYTCHFFVVVCFMCLSFCVSFESQLCICCTVGIIITIVFFFIPHFMPYVFLSTFVMQKAVHSCIVCSCQSKLFNNHALCMLYECVYIMAINKAELGRHMQSFRWRRRRWRRQRWWWLQWRRRRRRRRHWWWQRRFNSSMTI